MLITERICNFGTSIERCNAVSCSTYKYISTYNNICCDIRVYAHVLIKLHHMSRFLLFGLCIPVGYLNYILSMKCVCVCVLDRNYNRFPKQGRAEHICTVVRFIKYIHHKPILRACI